MHEPAQKNYKTKQKNSSHVYARTFIFSLSFLWSLVGIKYLGQIRRQLVIILTRQHFATSRILNSAGLSFKLVAPDSYFIWLYS